MFPEAPTKRDIPGNDHSVIVGNLKISGSGVGTGMCVFHTLTVGFMLDYYITLVEDCCATVTSRPLGRLLLEHTPIDEIANFAAGHSENISEYGFVILRCDMGDAAWRKAMLRQTH
jgi:hypothetical protein